MTDLITIRQLFETHLTVSDLKRSIDFYKNVVGLVLGFDASEHGVVFFWIGGSRRSMLGLWSLGITPLTPLGLRLHLAFEVGLDDLWNAPKRLKAMGIKPLSLFGVETMEPTVISWMPAASIYFRDPDGHLLEYLAMLDEEPRADLGIIPWSEWRKRTTP
jgi:lactoylglutathione lyase